jgi:hypothetical protein
MWSSLHQSTKLPWCSRLSRRSHISSSMTVQRIEIRRPPVRIWQGAYSFVACCRADPRPTWLGCCFCMVRAEALRGCIQTSPTPSRAPELTSTIFLLPFCSRAVRIVLQIFVVRALQYGICVFWCSLQRCLKASVQGHNNTTPRLTCLMWKEC